MRSHFILEDTLQIEDVNSILNESKQIRLSDAARKRIINCHAFLKNKIEQNTEPIYGINTGFGSLCNTAISDKELAQLQCNLIRSHACGTGDFVRTDIVKIMLLLKIKSLSAGHSGISIELVDLLISLFNLDILPVVFEQGSLGASGDLAPLSHVGLCLIGEGQVWYKGKIESTESVLKLNKLAPLVLQAKEGLAMINGTQFSTAHALWSLIEAKSLFAFAQAAAALSIEAFNCDVAPFYSKIHEIRGQKGQIKVAQQINELINYKESKNRKKHSVQDPYSFRCVPQVHGATLDTLQFIEELVLREMNGVTDNPNIFPEENLILSGGNFHAQHMALAQDFMAISMSEIANISERRTYQLISGVRELPVYLIANPGVNSGLMIVQYTAASIVSQNKQLCSPASVDSIVSSLGQEDHVSMAANAGTKLVRLIDNVRTVLSIEWLTANQAMTFRPDYNLAGFLTEQSNAYRKVVSVLDKDRQLSIDIQQTIQFSKVVNWEQS